MTPIWQIVLLASIDRVLDYLPPTDWSGPPPLHCRIQVPLGKREAIGWVIGASTETNVLPNQLRPCVRVIDAAPPLDAGTLALIQWTAHYYHHPLGRVLATALPVLLRQGAPAVASVAPHWRLTESACALELEQVSGVRLRELLALLRGHPLGLSEPQLLAVPAIGRDVLRRAAARGWIEPAAAPPAPAVDPVFGQSPHVLNADQQAAVDALRSAQGYTPMVLEGVTGSGKTEVYLQALETVLKAGRQALLLAPEIGLIPQLKRRVQARFGSPLALLHSGMTERARLQSWLAARDGQVRLLLGTRSAVFAPLPELGLIIVDEEHDGAYKQEEGLRYSARDLALWRARRSGVPIVLGSATPSLESFYRAERGDYRLLRLPLRAGSGQEPTIELIDMRPHAAPDGLSPPLLQAIARELARGGQVLLFQNRRGYAPMLRCRTCGWIAGCTHCDARLTLHREPGKRDVLICHHCGARRPSPPQCPDCGTPDPDVIGMGTARVEESLQRHFPDARLARIDRDSTRRQGSLEQLLDAAVSGRLNLLVGTQMLAKGHHLPHLGLVAILDVDQGLYSPDFRAAERMGQLVVQVAGRSGRELRAGTTLIQTHRPDHPWLRQLLIEGYAGFARSLLVERREAHWPPFTRLALLRAQTAKPEPALAFLEAVGRCLPPPAGMQVLGPVPAPMARRAGTHRAQLLLVASSAAPLHRYLDRLLPRLSALPEGQRGVRWSLDVDPQDLF
ncbi:MAG: primosomal protein N' [Pseudomonadota bacterium]